MGRYTTDSGSATFTPAPVGTHVARCFRIVDLGTQHGEYKGNPTRRNQILVSWELPNELIEIEGKEVPTVTSRFYTNSLGEKANLRADLEAWRGQSFTDVELQKFDLHNILGKPCMLIIIGGENGKTKVAGVAAMPKGTECPPQVNKNFTFWLDDDTDIENGKFEQLSDGIKNIIKKSEEWSSIQNGPVDTESRYATAAAGGGNDDDIPF
jgi:hypothetical protein